MNRGIKNKIYKINHRQTKNLRRLSLFMLLSSIFVACEPDTVCHQELGVAAQISFQVGTITSTGDTTYSNQVDSIAVVGVGSEIAMRGNNIKMMGLELRPDTSLTAYLILYHNQIDTLYIQHTPRPYYVSLACGCTIYHTITAAWSSDTRVDSVSIINANVEGTTEENLCIHWHE